MEKTSLTKDQQTSTLEGDRTAGLPEGVYIQKVTTHADARGSLFEIYNQKWEHHGGPVVHGTILSIRPHWAKGWAIHADHDDRYLILHGEVELVLYDVRENSSTKGLLSVIMLSEKDRRMINIPIGIWHATENVG